jgi:exosortase
VSDPTPTPSLALDPPATRPAGRAALAVGAGFGLLLALAYASDLRVLADAWSTNPDYSHGILVVPVALLIAWRLRPAPGEAAIAPSPWGALALAAVLGARAWLYPRGDFWLTSATIVPAVAATVWACGGWGLLRKVWPAVAFLVFLLTVPGRFDATISLPLQRFASRASCALIRLSGTWVINEGNVIMVGGDRLEVARACSGLAMLISLSATVTAASLLLTMERWKRLVLLACIVPIALLCNVLRISATVACYRVLGTEAGRHFAHDLAGWLMMPLAMVLVGLALAWMSWVVVDDDDQEPLLPPGGPRLAVAPIRVETEDRR